MVNEKLIKDFIQTELVNDRRDDELLNTDNLIESGTIDSLGIIKLISYIEKTYLIKITNDDIVVDNFETIEAISTFIRNKFS